MIKSSLNDAGKRGIVIAPDYAELFPLASLQRDTILTCVGPYTPENVISQWREKKFLQKLEQLCSLSTHDKTQKK